MPAFGPCRRACGCAGLFFCRRTPLSCLSSPHRSLPRLSSRLPFFSCRPAFPTARVSLCPCLPLPVFLSARVSLCPCFSLPVSPSVRVSLSPQLPSFVGSSSVVCIPSGFSSVISCFSVHRPSLAACCPSPVAPSIVQRLPLVVHRSLRRSSSIARRLLSVAHCLSLAAHCPSLAARCLLSVVHCPSFAARCLSPVASPVPRRLYLYPVAAPRLFPLPFGPDHGFCIRGIPACVSSGAACRVVPQRVPSVGLSAKMRPPSVPWSPRRF